MDRTIFIVFLVFGSGLLALGRHVQPRAAIDCMKSNDCPSHHFCDLDFRSCHSCWIVCEKDNERFCKEHCPETWGVVFNMTTMLPLSLSVPILTSTPFTTDIEPATASLEQSGTNYAQFSPSNAQSIIRNFTPAANHQPSKQMTLLTTLVVICLTILSISVIVVIAWKCQHKLAKKRHKSASILGSHTSSINMEDTNVQFSDSGSPLREPSPPDHAIEMQELRQQPLLSDCPNDDEAGNARLDDEDSDGL